MRKITTLLLFLIFFPINLLAEDWIFLEPDKELIKSVVTLSRSETIDGGTRIHSVTGVIVDKTDKVASNNEEYFLGKILTCEHIEGDELDVRFWNGKTSKGRSISKNREDDLMVLSAYLHKDTISVEILDKTNPYGIVYGMGGEAKGPPSLDKIRVYGGNRIGPETNRYYLDAKSINGDSGSPVFYNNKLCGIVSGGMTIFDREDGNGQYVWPLRTATIKTIKKILNE